MLKRSKRQPCSPCDGAIINFISVDVWSLTCLHLIRCPRKVFMILSTIRGLRFDDTWWSQFWSLHLKASSELKIKPHWFLKTQCKLSLHKPILRLVYGMFCARCGCRYHHTIFQPYKMRLCNECIRTGHISNVVLWLEYGINMEKLVKYRYFIRHMGLQKYIVPKGITSLTAHPLDLVLRGRKNMVFLWRDDVAAIFDLEEAKKVQKQRLVCVNVIKAHVKRLFLTCVLLNKAKRLFVEKRHFFEKTHDNEARRVAFAPIEATKCIGSFRYWNDIPLKVAFRGILPLPMLADHEYVPRTAIDKLKLKKDDVDALITTLSAGGNKTILPNHVMKITE